MATSAFTQLLSSECVCVWGEGGCRSTVSPIISTLVQRYFYVCMCVGGGVEGGVQEDCFPSYTHSGVGIFVC